MSTDLLQLVSSRNASRLTKDVVDPSSANKASTGFSQGSLWLNTSSLLLFLLSDDTLGTWISVNQPLGPLANLSAIVGPVATNDSTGGFAVGSIWIDIVTDIAYIAVDVTPTSAIWTVISGNKNNFIATVIPGTANDSTQGYSVGSRWIDTVTNTVYTATSVTVGAAKWSAAGLATVAAVFPASPTPGTLFHDTTNDLTYLWDGNSWIDIAAAGSSGIAVNNYSATVAPSLVNDATQSYSVGSVWIDVVSRAVYVNVDPTAGSAIWFKVQQGSQWSIVTIPHLAVSGEALFVDTSLSAISVTLPVTPTLGDRIKIADAKGTFLTNNLTLLRNGSTIMGLAQNMTIDNDNVSFSMTFNGSDWRITT